MVSTHFNPFTWDKTAEKVDSSVVSLELKDPEGNTLHISGLEKDILISIPRVAGSNLSSKVESYFIKPSNMGSMQYHKVAVNDEGAVLEVKVGTGITYHHSCDFFS